jgi:hypothetical protein
MEKFYILWAQKLSKSPSFMSSRWRTGALSNSKARTTPSDSSTLWKTTWKVFILGLSSPCKPLPLRDL